MVQEHLLVRACEPRIALSCFACWVALSGLQGSMLSGLRGSMPLKGWQTACSIIVNACSLAILLRGTRFWGCIASYVWLVPQRGIASSSLRVVVVLTAWSGFTRVLGCQGAWCVEPGHCQLFLLLWCFGRQHATCLSHAGGMA